MTYRFGQGFLEAVRVRGLSAQQLAELASVSPATVSAALHGRDLQLPTAMRIARALMKAPIIPELTAWGQRLDDA